MVNIGLILDSDIFLTHFVSSFTEYNQPWTYKDVVFISEITQL